MLIIVIVVMVMIPLVTLMMFQTIFLSTLMSLIVLPFAALMLAQRPRITIAETLL